MIVASVRMLGTSELINKLKKIGINIKPVLQKVVIETTGIALRTAVELAPHRKGMLARSIKSRFENDYLIGIIGTNLVYAKIHEFGGIVKARNVKNLTIPLNREAELTTARKLIESGKGVIFRNPKTGKLLVWKKEGKRVIPMYVLKPSVIIPAHPYMRPTAQAVRGLFLDKLKSDIEGLLKG